MTGQPSAPPPAPTLDPAAFVATAAPGRECGTCTLCCKVYDVPAVPKPMSRWCPHCRPGRGCGIWETRPQACRSFFCLWMTEGWLGPEWKPERSKIVLSVDPVNRFLLAQVDPGAPGAWKKEPFHGQLRAWARASLGLQRLVIVFVDKVGTVILPDRDVPVGVIAPNERLVLREKLGPRGPYPDVEKIAA